MVFILKDRNGREKEQTLYNLLLTNLLKNYLSEFSARFTDCPYFIGGKLSNLTVHH